MLSAVSNALRSCSLPKGKVTSRAYGHLCSIFYELDKPDAPTESLDYYTRQAQKAHGQILEPMCGTGRFLVPIAEQGHDITGFDSSREMLLQCKEKCRQAGVQPTLLHRSFESFHSPSQYKLVFIPTSSFSLLTTPEEVSRSLRVIYRYLQAGGKFIFEVDTITSKDEAEMTWKSRSVQLNNNSRICLHTASKFDSSSQVQRTHCRYQLIENTEITCEENEHLDVRLYRPDELITVLEDHNFRVLNQFAPYSERTSIHSADTLVYECEREE